MKGTNMFVRDVQMKKSALEGILTNYGNEITMDELGNLPVTEVKMVPGVGRAGLRSVFEALRRYQAGEDLRPKTMFQAAQDEENA